MGDFIKTSIPWALEIPSHWKTIPNKYVMRKVKNICEIYQGQDIISLSINGVVVRDLNAGGKMPASFDGYQYVTEGNLLMCLFDYDVTPRCIGYIKQSGVTSPAYSQFEMLDGYSARYFYYYYLMIDHSKGLLHLAKNLRHSFTEEDLGSIEVVAPPYEEQVTIARFLDQKCAEIDALSSKIREEIILLQNTKNAFICESVFGGLDRCKPMADSGIDWVGYAPSDWVVQPLSLYFKERKNINSLNDETNLLSLSYGKVVQRDINATGGLLPMSFSTYNIVEPDDIIIRPTDLQNDQKSLRTGLCKEHGIITSAYIALYRIAPISAAFVHYVLHAYDIEKVFYNMGSGVRQGLGFDSIKKLKIPVPSLGEQEEIVRCLDEKCAEIDGIIEGKEAQIGTLDLYKKSLIYEYVTGKKEVAQ